MRIPSREHVNNKELLHSVKNTVGIIEIYNEETENVPYIKYDKEVSSRVDIKKTIQGVC